jgi:Leucine-rich repeat (LRR) protein
MFFLPLSLFVEIERISLASNNIKTLPEEIGACVTLKELYLSNNAKLNSIPSTAGHLRQLQELVARKCPALKALPAAGQ